MRRALIVAFVGAMLIAPPAAAADPEPPNTSMNDHGPNVPVWQTFEIFGTAGSSPIDHFECRLDDGPWETCTSPWDPALSGGDHAIGARAVDINGLADPTPATAAFFVDVDGPSVSVLLNEGAATTGRLVVGLDLAFDDRASVGDILISNSPELDGEGLLANAASAWVVGPPTWRLDTFGGTDHAGPHTVYVQAKDAFGNWSDPASDTIVFDPALDSTVTIRLAVSQNPAPIGGEIKLFGIGHADDGAGIHDGVMILWVDGTSLSNSDVSWSIENGTWIDASGLAPGTYVLRATFEDSADLEDASASLTFKVGPALALLGPQAYFSSPQPPHDPWDPAPFTLPVYSRHASAVAFQCRVDGGSWSSCTNGLSVAVLPDGWHLAEVRGIDSAGRVQAVPETFLWFVRPTGGDFEVMPVGGYAPEPNVHLLFAPPAGALALRVSNSRAVDPQGRLSAADEVAPIGAGIPTQWNLTDADAGGTPGDGNKIVAVQWKLADGTWSTPSLRVIRLDRSVPELSIQVEKGSAFVDEDELLVVATASELAAIDVADDLADLGPSGNPTDSLVFVAVPVGNVPLGAVVVRHVYARARDQAGNLSAVVHATVTVDRSSPTAGTPAVTFDVGSRVSKSVVDAWVATSASDTGSGVAKLALQRRAGDSWANVSSVSTTSLKVLRELSLSGAAAFRSRGTDRLGHVGAWATTTSLVPALRSDGHGSIAYSAGWSTVAKSSALGNSLHRTKVVGAQASFKVTGRAVGIVAPRGPSYGRFEVLIDGVKVGVVDLRRDASRSRVLVFAKSWSAAATHTIVIRNRGTGGREIALDGLVVLP